MKSRQLIEALARYGNDQRNAIMALCAEWDVDPGVDVWQTLYFLALHVQESETLKPSEPGSYRLASGILADDTGGSDDESG